MIVARYGSFGLQARDADPVVLIPPPPPPPAPLPAPTSGSVFTPLTEQQRNQRTLEEEWSTGANRVVGLAPQILEVGVPVEGLIAGSVFDSDFPVRWRQATDVMNRVRAVESHPLGAGLTDASYARLAQVSDHVSILGTEWMAYARAASEGADPAYVAGLKDIQRWWANVAFHSLGELILGIGPQIDAAERAIAAEQKAAAEAQAQAEAEARALAEAELAAAAAAELARRQAEAAERAALIASSAAQAGADPVVMEQVVQHTEAAIEAAIEAGVPEQQAIRQALEAAPIVAQNILSGAEPSLGTGSVIPPSGSVLPKLALYAAGGFLLLKLLRRN